MSYLEKAQEIHQMMGQGQMLEAFEKFYHEDVVMVEATGDVREGKATSREFEKKWLEGLAQVHGGGVTTMASDEENGITMVESWMDAEFKDGTRMKLEEVAVQKWQGDQIIHERFYYNAPPQ